jgi:hypothetical protein
VLGALFPDLLCGLGFASEHLAFVAGLQLVGRLQKGTDVGRVLPVGDAGVGKAAVRRTSASVRESGNQEGSRALAPSEERVAPLVSETQFLVRSSALALAALARSDSLTDDHLKSHVLPDSPAQDVCQQ